MFASWINCSSCEMAFWTAKSCSIVFIGGGAMTFSSIITFSLLLKYLVRTMKPAIKRVAIAKT
jgi:hypothetical protein